MKLTHPDSDPKKPITVNDDHAEAYLSQGWEPVEDAAKK